MRLNLTSSLDKVSWGSCNDLVLRDISHSLAKPITLFPSKTAKPKACHNEELLYFSISKVFHRLITQLPSDTMSSKISSGPQQAKCSPYLQKKKLKVLGLEERSLEEADILFINSLIMGDIIQLEIKCGLILPKKGVDSSLAKLKALEV